jgi:hypothetical protein
MPEFSINNMISLHYSNQTIIENSAIFSIDDLPPFGSGHHSLCYIEGVTTGHIFSKPIEIIKTNLTAVLENKKEEGSTLIQEAKRISTIFNEIDFNMPDLPNLKNVEGDRHLVRAVQSILLGYFNIVWIPIYSTDQNLVFGWQ